MMKSSSTGKEIEHFLVKTGRSSIYNNVGVAISFIYFVAHYIADIIIYYYNCSVVKPLNTYRYGY